METKRCIQCGEVKSVEEFYRKRVTPQGTIQYQSYCKPCFQFRATHKDLPPAPYRRPVMTDEERHERRNAQQRELNKTERRKQYLADYAARNRERENAKVRRHYQRNRDQINAKAAAKRAANPDLYRETLTAWRRNHKDTMNAQTARRRARILGADGRYTAAEWEAQKASQNFTCLWCGRTEPEIKLHADHVVPLTKGGTNTIDNIQGLCKVCNSRKADRAFDFRVKD